MLRIRQLEALSAVISTGSISGAARALGVSQPAMSRLISDLSKNFEFNLFSKRDGQLKPTQEILLLYPDIERVLELMKNIQHTSSEINERKAGHLKIACLPGFATNHLPNVVA
jgi:DNA-binding transcriptional LysR family regulator